MLYQDQHLTLHADRLEEPHGTLHLDDLPDRTPALPLRLRDDAPPIIEKLWRAALFDAEANLCKRAEGRYFAAGGRGQGWNGMVFTRDQAFASLLGLGRVYPQLMWEALRTSNAIRVQMGLKIDAEEFVPDLPFENTGLTREEHKRQCGSPSFIRRTDDVLWLWWAQDLLSDPTLDTPANWQWLYATGQWWFREVYALCFDEADGLYRGQSSFVDIGLSGYPERFGPFGSLEAKRRSIRIKATSTNCLYFRGLAVMADAARRLDRRDEADAWERRATTLRQAIHARLVRGDGTVAYFVDEAGVVEDRQHTLATAFAILLGVLEGEAAREAIRRYPVQWWGVPLFHPFFDNARSYHNNSAWPFSDAFFLRAREQALHVDESWRGIALTLRSCRGDTFNEWTAADSGRPLGKAAQLWTIGAFVGHCRRAGLLELPACKPAL